MLNKGIQIYVPYFESLKTKINITNMADVVVSPTEVKAEPWFGKKEQNLLKTLCTLTIPSLYKC